jgi:hypothetical protein
VFVRRNVLQVTPPPVICPSSGRDRGKRVIFILGTLLTKYLNLRIHHKGYETRSNESRRCQDVENNTYRVHGTIYLTHRLLEDRRRRLYANPRSPLMQGIDKSSPCNMVRSLQADCANV